MAAVRDARSSVSMDALMLMIVGLIALEAAMRPACAASWEPDRFTKEETLKLCTNVQNEGKYCFPVWLVVIDHQVYVRLGSRAADRVEHSTTKPVVGVEVAGQQFEHVRGVSVPDYADRVAKAMGDKYTSDILVRFFSHPLTLRLVPEERPPP